MKLHHLTLALGLTALISGCDQIPVGSSQDTSAAPVSDTSAVVATVNGTPITEQGLAVYQQQRHSRRPNDPASQDREAVLEELINLELARQAGVEQGLDEKPDIALQIDQQRRAVVAAAAIQHQLQVNPVSDEELKKLYDDNVGDGKEYKARHILVEDQQQARDLMEAGKFAEAREALLPFARSGNADAEELIGVMYALGLGVEWILLDNYTVEDTAEAVRRRDAAGSATLLESSGNVSLQTIGAYARAGVDAPPPRTSTSVSAITGSERAGSTTSPPTTWQ